MRELKLFSASVALTCIALFPAISSASDELDVTMDIIEDLADIDDEVSTMRGPGDHDEALSNNEHDGDDFDEASDEEDEHRFDDIDRGDDFENDEDFDFEDEHSLAEEDSFEHDEGEDVDDDDIDDEMDDDEMDGDGSNDEGSDDIS